MELLKKVILAACLLSVVLTLAGMTTPGEKYARQLKFIFSLVFLTGIAVTISSGDFELELPAAADAASLEGYEEISQAADKAVLESAEASVIDMVSRILTSQGISFEKISADVNMTDDGSININWIGYCGDECENAAEAVRKNIGDVEVKCIE